MVRQGAVVSYLVAADDADQFNKLCEFELGAEDLVSARVLAESKRSDVAVTVRIPHFEIRAANVLASATQHLQTDEAATTGRNRGPVAAAIIAALLALFSGMWLWRRRSASKTPIAER